MKGLLQFVRGTRIALSIIDDALQRVEERLYERIHSEPVRLCPVCRVRAADARDEDGVCVDCLERALRGAGAGWGSA